MFTWPTRSTTATAGWLAFRRRRAVVLVAAFRAEFFPVAPVGALSRGDVRRRTARPGLVPREVAPVVVAPVPAVVAVGPVVAAAFVGQGPLPLVAHHNQLGHRIAGQCTRALPFATSTGTFCPMNIFSRRYCTQAANILSTLSLSVPLLFAPKSMVTEEKLLEQLDEWMDWLETPNDNFGGYPVCPFLAPERKTNKLLIEF